MRQTKRMLLIPEDVYQQTLQQQTDGSPIGQVRTRMRQIERSTTSGDDVRAAKYNQEFKRMNKLVRENEERPMDVRLQNVQEIAEAIPSPPSPPPRETKIVVLGKKRIRKPSKKKRVEEEEKWEDASPIPPKLRSANISEQPSTSANKIYSMTRYGVSEYIRKNAQKLGITTDGHVLKSDGLTPYKTSKIDEIVTYLLNRDKRSQYKNQPVGYKEFVSRANSDPFLQQHLFTEQQFGKGKAHKKKIAHVFAFKPTLW